jgi:GNAT superfamily N-acetyltransferase
MAPMGIPRKSAPLSSTVRIRPLQDNDIPHVVSLWYRTWHATFPALRHPDPLSTWEQHFRDDLTSRGTIWVAERDGHLAGFLVVMVRDNYLAQLFVEPTSHRQGIGTVLLHKAKELCPQGLSLHTLQQNVQARRFYERHGFVAGRHGLNAINGQPNVEYCWQPA